MPRFKDISVSKTLEEKFVDRVFVYLESKTDFNILADRLFFDMEGSLEFVPTDSMYESGGCAAVMKAVEEGRKEGIAAFGILDRDVLLRERKWDCLWETDDLKFQAKKNFGSHIFTLLRWEIENYLLDPEQIETILADKGPEPRPLKSAGEAASELLGHLEALTPVAAANAVLHENGLKQLAFGFCVAAKRKADVQKQVEEQIERNVPDAFNEDRLNHFLEKVEKFRPSNESDPGKVIEGLLRIVDGKRAFYRINRMYRIKDEIIFMLARRIRENGHIPDELEDLVESLRPENPSI